MNSFSRYDPTYDKAEIDANPAWKLAFWMSELFNDDAPLGWSAFISSATRQIKEARAIGQALAVDRVGRTPEVGE